MDFFIKIHAQAADATAKATIPFTPPNVPTPTGIAGWTATPTPANVPIISLETDSVQIGVNEKVTVKVKINTAGIPIRSLKFNAKYDPLFFKITDAEPTIANAQILYNDDFFLRYTAPELLAEQPVNGPVNDIWMLGCLFVEMFSKFKIK